MKKLAIFSLLIFCVYFIGVSSATAQTDKTTKTEKKIVTKNNKTQSIEQNKSQSQIKPTINADTKIIDKRTTTAPETSKQKNESSTNTNTVKKSPKFKMPTHMNTTKVQLSKTKKNDNKK
jgi:hypothetical protein